MIVHTDTRDKKDQHLHAEQRQSTPIMTTITISKAPKAIITYKSQYDLSRANTERPLCIH